MSSMLGSTGMKQLGKSTGLSGSGYSQVSLPSLSPQQMQLFQQLFSGAQGGIQGGLQNLSGLASGDQSQFEQMEAPALRQFGQLQSQLASRFSGLGTGARRGSGFHNAQSEAATDLSERLAAQRMGLQQSAISQLLGLGQNLLGTSLTDNFLIPKKKPFWQELLGSAAGGLGQGLGSLTGLGFM